MCTGRGGGQNFRIPPPPSPLPQDSHLAILPILAKKTTSFRQNSTLLEIFCEHPKFLGEFFTKLQIAFFGGEVSIGPRFLRYRLPHLYPSPTCTGMDERNSDLVIPDSGRNYPLFAVLFQELGFIGYIWALLMLACLLITIYGGGGLIILHMQKKSPKIEIICKNFLKFS